MAAINAQKSLVSKRVAPSLLVRRHSPSLLAALSSSICVSTGLIQCDSTIAYSAHASGYLVAGVYVAQLALLSFAVFSAAVLRWRKKPQERPNSVRPTARQQCRTT